MEEERHEFISRLVGSISNWKGKPQDLLDIFRPEEIECLLSDCIKNISEYGSCYRAFVEFVFRSGYKDVSQLDDDGKPMLRRTTPIHHAAKRIQLAAVVQLGQDPNILVPQTGDSPLHLAVMFDRRKIAEMLLRSGANPTLVNAEGLTLLDIISKGHRDDVDLAMMVFELGNEKYPLWLIHGPLKSAVSNGLVNLAKLLLTRCADQELNSSLPRIFYYRWEKEVTRIRVSKNLHDDDSLEIVSKIIDEHLVELLHLALCNGEKNTVETLLRRGANPNSTCDYGLTALHIACMQGDDDNAVEAFFDICDAIGQTVCLDTRDIRGDTALHRAVRSRFTKTSELLLRRGADPNLADKKGLTLLHSICSQHQLMELWIMLLFEIDDQTQQRRVQVDAQDDLGNTSLHLALLHGHKGMAEVLLRNGANPNLANAEGSTALHVVCKDHLYYDFQVFAELFFKICDDNRQFVQIDAQDKLGRTPLQWAVASNKPLMVNLLLDRGAEMSRFVFPTESFYGERFNPKFNYVSGIKLIMASGALLTIEILESAGYELESSDALTVMKFFDKHRLFEQNLEKRWHDDATASCTKKEMVFHNLSLYDLNRMRPEEAETLLIFGLGSTKKWRELPERCSQACHMHLCEKLSRRFFRNWSLVAFMELTRCRLPFECCESIIDKSVSNKDLCNICLAAAMKSS
ncbi:ankyrin-3-like [Trichogramma pretiosum]|uniref:ankyrin-3-like n=1 Tax=Trichogramma pretiosum TaxID=7493 RepID=UPI0006C94077|nr:ankyrin-3-like [Trichogramma pretiosum]